MTESKIYLQDVRFSKKKYVDSYWCDLPFYRELVLGKIISFDTPVTFFVGENGSGKSTLIEAIAVGMGYNAEGGSKNFNFSTRDTTSMLYEELEISKIAYESDGFFLRAESFYNMATNIEDLGINIGNYGGRSLHRQSHGESFLSLVQNRFYGDGFYILDEPEAALSPMRQLALLIEINELVKNNSQFVIATHSPILLAYPNAQIYSLDFGIDRVDYTDTEHYKTTKSFLNDPDVFLSKLFDTER